MKGFSTIQSVLKKIVIFRTHIWCRPKQWELPSHYEKFYRSMDTVLISLLDPLLKSKNTRRGPLYKRSGTVILSTELKRPEKGGKS